jgi:hypothetical protein
MEIDYDGSRPGEKEDHVSKPSDLEAFLVGIPRLVLMHYRTIP